MSIEAGIYSMNDAIAVARGHPQPAAAKMSPEDWDLMAPHLEASP